MASFVMQPRFLMNILSVMELPTTKKADSCSSSDNEEEFQVQNISYSEDYGHVQAILANQS